MIEGALDKSQIFYLVCFVHEVFYFLPNLSAKMSGFGEKYPVFMINPQSCDTLARRWFI